MIRRFTVTAIEGHTALTTFDAVGPTFLAVLVSAENLQGESIQFTKPLDDQPKIGDVIEFTEGALPAGAILSKERA